MCLGPRPHEGGPAVRAKAGDVPGPAALAAIPLPAPAAPPQAAEAPRSRWLWGLAALLFVALAVTALTIRELSQRHPAAAATVARTAYDDNSQAREMYTTARFELSMRSADSLAAAQKSFQQLVDRYPERAAGWSGLASTYLLLREFGSMPDAVAYPQAQRGARRAPRLPLIRSSPTRGSTRPSSPSGGRGTLPRRSRRLRLRCDLIQTRPRPSTGMPPRVGRTGTSTNRCRPWRAPAHLIPAIAR